MKKMFLLLSAMLLSICFVLGIQAESVYAEEVSAEAAVSPESPVVTVSNVASSGKVRLNWEAVDGAVQYRVYRATGEDGIYKNVFTTEGNQYTHTSGVAETEYYYYVVAVAEDGTESEASDIVNHLCNLARPVVTVSNVASSGKVRLNWEAVDGAVEYDVYRATSKEGTYKNVFTTDGTQYTHTSGESGVRYYYKVKAIAQNTDANSAYSSIKSRLCDLPRPNVTASNVASSGKVRLNWEAVDGAVAYKIYRATSEDGTYKNVFTTENTRYTHTSGEPGVKYYYTVKAVATDTNANSAQSAMKSRTCDLAQPVVSIKLNSDGKPRLSWDAIEGAVEYQIYRSTSENGTYKLKYTATKTTYTNTGATDGTTYFYKVRAIHTNDVAHSVYSSVVSAQAGMRTRYINRAEIPLYVAPDDFSDYIMVRYQSEVMLGEAVQSQDDGKWYAVYYNGSLYYIWQETGSDVLTTRKYNYGYTGKTVYEQQVLDYAMMICTEWDTVYAHNQSNGVMNSDGTYGFDCSGFVSYVLNTIMQNNVPTYRVTANLSGLYQLDAIYNEDYPGEFCAIDIDEDEKRPGDVLFFQTDGSLAHCGIYLGGGEFVHSTSPLNGVGISNLSGSYGTRLIGVRRYLPEKITPANTIRYINTRCNLYEERTSDSTALQVIPKGDPVTVLYTKTDNMAYVRVEDGTCGFVWLKYLSKSAS